MTKKSPLVTKYITGAPSWAKPILKELRATILSVSPDLEEKISYGIPYYALRGRVAYFGYWKAHCSFHWLNAQDKKVFAKDLTKVKVAGSTLHILKGEKVPVALIKNIVRYRIKNNR
jgi:uncharacterized protein YdhG (YjbR/CyaY superfamily)